MYGRFITIEGGEGAGKSSVVQRLAESLQDRGLSVVVTREPGGSSLAEEIRRVILHGQKHIEPLAELLLFLAARAQHVTEVIQPALQAGKTVLCDRYTDSTIAYQVFGRGLNLEEVETLCAIATHRVAPESTLLLDIDPTVAFARIRNKQLDRMEKEDKSFFQRVREGFQFQAQRFPERIRVIDAAQPLDAVLQQCLENVS